MFPTTATITDATTSSRNNDTNDPNLLFHFPTPPQPRGPSGLFGEDFYPTNVDSFGWVFDNDLDDVFPSMLPSPRFDIPGMNLDCMFQESDVEHPRNLEQADGQASAESEELDDLPQPTPRDRCSPDDVWPMEWHAASNQRLTLPVLGLPLEDSDMSLGSFYQLPNIDDRSRTRLLNSIRLPLERVPWQTVSLTNFPSNEKLDHCLDMFFRHFDRVSLNLAGLHLTTALLRSLTSSLQTFTVIHRPTFDPAKFPVLTLSMASVGANYTRFDGAHVFSNSLSELVRRLLVFMVSQRCHLNNITVFLIDCQAEHDPRFLRSDQYLAAKLFQSVQGYCGASRRLFELSESSRSSLVHNAKSMGLFCYRAPPSPENISIEERWHQWVTQEKYRRLGWAVYVSNPDGRDHWIVCQVLTP